ncbi:hypothetical protein B0T20DRAFT_373243 [Sordaria brevicollis]|uniref:Uncharacterized protein n=1 Tax=Sordaria brevicollis TaxID=83679 RepID=A0AAE0PHK0_SORBR|nr:hypothetical protein B0T20DRAFT_373243 [Sordaria brevicollis]
MPDPSLNQPQQHPPQPNHAQSVFTTLQMEPIDPAMTAGEANTSQRRATQPSPPQSFPSNMGQFQNLNSHPTLTFSNPSQYPGMGTPQHNPNMSVMGNGNTNGMAPAQGLVLNQQTLFNFQSPPPPSANPANATTQANLHHNMANMGARQAFQQSQPSLNGHMRHNSGGNSMIGFSQHPHPATTMPASQYDQQQQPINGMMSPPLGHIPSSFDYSTVPGAALHYSNGIGFRNNGNSLFNPNSTSGAQLQAPQSQPTALSNDALSRAAETMNNQVATETAKKGASRGKKAASQTSATSQEGNPTQPAKGKRGPAPTKRTKAEGTSDPTAPQEPPMKRQKTTTNNTEANAMVAPMANMSTTMSTPTFSSAMMPNSKLVAQPSPNPIPPPFAAMVHSAPVPSLNSVPPTHMVKQTTANKNQEQTSALPRQVTPVPLPNIPVVAKVPSVYPRRTPAPASVAALASSRASVPCPAPTQTPTPNPTPSRASQHAAQPSKRSPLGLSTQGAVDAAMTQSPTPAPGQLPRQPSGQGQTQSPPGLLTQNHILGTGQPIGQQPIQQQAWNTIQQQAQNVAQQLTQNAQNSPQRPVQHNVQGQAKSPVQPPGQNQTQVAGINDLQSVMKHPSQHAVQQQKANPQAQQQQAVHNAQQQALQQVQQQAHGPQQAQKPAQQKAQTAPQISVQRPNQVSPQAQTTAVQASTRPTGTLQPPTPQPLPTFPDLPPAIPNVDASILSKPANLTIISHQGDCELYCVFGQQDRLHKFRVRRSTLEYLHLPPTITTSPFPNTAYINFNEVLTTPGRSPYDLSNLPGEKPDSHMDAFCRLLRLLDDPAKSGETATCVETIFRLSNLQPALGMRKEYVEWLRKCMVLFIGQVAIPVLDTNGVDTQDDVEKYWHGNAMTEDLFDEVDEKGLEVRKNKWEKALEACKNFTWMNEWRMLVSRLSYLCSVDKDAAGKWVVKKPGKGGVLNRSLIGEETIDAIVSTRAKTVNYLLPVVSNTAKTWNNRIQNGQRNGGCRNKTCQAKRTGCLMHVVKGLGLRVPPKKPTNPETNNTDTNPSYPYIDPTLPTIDPTTYHGSHSKLTHGMALHQVFDIMKAVQHERRGKYRMSDAMLNQYSGKCNDCLKGSAFGPGEMNPTNPLFPMVDLLYEMLWEIRTKMLEWTEYPWGEKIVTELGIEDDPEDASAKEARETVERLAGMPAGKENARIDGGADTGGQDGTAGGKALADGGCR